LEPGRIWSETAETWDGSFLSSSWQRARLLACLFRFHSRPQAFPLREVTMRDTFAQRKTRPAGKRVSMSMPAPRVLTGSPSQESPKSLGAFRPGLGPSQFLVLMLTRSPSGHVIMGLPYRVQNDLLNHGRIHPDPTQATASRSRSECSSRSGGPAGCTRYDGFRDSRQASTARCVPPPQLLDPSRGLLSCLANLLAKRRNRLCLSNPGRNRLTQSTIPISQRLTAGQVVLHGVRLVGIPQPLLSLRTLYPFLSFHMEPCNWADRWLVLSKLL